jgi:hypothetical protein
MKMIDGLFSDPSLCSIEGEGGGDGGSGGGGGGDGGAAAALAAAGGDGGGQGGDGGQGGGDGGSGGGDEGKWLEQFSAEGGDAENPSNRDWLRSKGFKSIDDVAKSYRAAEQAIHAKGGINVPGADAKPEELEAFHKAIGRPEAADKYEFALPDGIAEDQLDMDVVGPLREIAFKAGVPAGMFKPLAEGVIAMQLDELNAAKTAEDGSFKEWEKAQGAQAPQKLAAVQSAMRALGVTQAEFAGMQNGLRIQSGQPGSARMMELFARLGEGMAEDTFLNPQDPKRRFGVSAAEAQAEVDKLIVDKDFQAKLSAKDPAAVERWNRLNAAIGAEKEREQRAAAAGG